MIRVDIVRNKGICTDFGRNILDGCRNDWDDMLLVDMAMNIPLRHLLELPFMNLALLHPKFITHYIDTSVPILILTNIDPLI